MEVQFLNFLKEKIVEYTHGHDIGISAEDIPAEDMPKYAYRLYLIYSLADNDADFNLLADDSVTKLRTKYYEKFNDDMSMEAYLERTRKEYALISSENKKQSEYIDFAVKYISMQFPSNIKKEYPLIEEILEGKNLKTLHLLYMIYKLGDYTLLDVESNVSEDQLSTTALERRSGIDYDDFIKVIDREFMRKTTHKKPRIQVTTLGMSRGMIDKHLKRVSQEKRREMDESISSLIMPSKSVLKSFGIPKKAAGPLQALIQSRVFNIAKYANSNVGNNVIHINGEVCSKVVPSSYYIGDGSGTIREQLLKYLSKLNINNYITLENDVDARIKQARAAVTRLLYDTMSYVTGLNSGLTDVVQKLIYMAKGEKDKSDSVIMCNDRILSKTLESLNATMINIYQEFKDLSDLEDTGIIHGLTSIEKSADQMKQNLVRGLYNSLPYVTYSGNLSRVIQAMLMIYTPIRHPRAFVVHRLYREFGMQPWLLLVAQKMIDELYKLDQNVSDEQATRYIRDSLPVDYMDKRWKKLLVELGLRAYQMMGTMRDIAGYSSDITVNDHRFGHFVSDFITDQLLQNDFKLGRIDLTSVPIRGPQNFGAWSVVIPRIYQLFHITSNYCTHLNNINPVVGMDQKSSVEHIMRKTCLCSGTNENILQEVMSRIVDVAVSGRWPDTVATTPFYFMVYDYLALPESAKNDLQVQTDSLFANVYQIFDLDTYCQYAYIGRLQKLRDANQAWRVMNEEKLTTQSNMEQIYHYLVGN